ncbi:hypothetical protein HMJ29_05930 [Hymenobacter taeanensis]|uniref:DUF2273 domain-containing protein n=1 Tax=Hymenobacter taeanensis TaxID=2735321 RepID=A0A6M6BEV6_9BACT|nr:MULTISPECIES: hypothetical protein [Hymenobacter]QJX46499.1 hypothetical protein HMJ29_05930 [Hymenobacter taeanensis]UOQ80362.1 hypothetical protein MUN83_16250 [Hymenobacter sp. 5414T-23]
MPNAQVAEAGSAPEVAYAAPVMVAQPSAAPSQPKIKAALPSRPRLAHRRLLVTPRYLLSKPAAASRPTSAAIHETRHLLLGIAVVAVGVVAGLLLGGWLGLGVGALLVILGYYFLGMAFGGEHAWLEVFQEFFNM